MLIKGTLPNTAIFVKFYLWNDTEYTCIFVYVCILKKLLDKTDKAMLRVEWLKYRHSKILVISQ